MVGYRQGKNILSFTILVILFVGIVSWSHVSFWDNLCLWINSLSGTEIFDPEMSEAFRLKPDAKTFVPVFFILLGLFFWYIQDMPGTKILQFTAFWAISVSLWGLVVFSSPTEFSPVKTESVFDYFSLEQKFFGLLLLFSIFSYILSKIIVEKNMESKSEKGGHCSSSALDFSTRNVNLFDPRDILLKREANGNIRFDPSRIVSMFCKTRPSFPFYTGGTNLSCDGSVLSLFFVYGEFALKTKKVHSVREVTSKGWNSRLALN